MHVNILPVVGSKPDQIGLPRDLTLPDAPCLTSFGLALFLH